ncbi:hypothetical protein E2562_031439 [Oryza meyeriana var. granulata]|uniref:Uncharacterized protein n=1 Tax=Oryza meyeriana var. granulata TaxID=110450 RepID=A0A6G1C1A8_9ORYZ|nr:hypothetical protein E2562_031439 [Oryza meyeriana var. granulata]
MELGEEEIANAVGTSLAIVEPLDVWAHCCSVGPIARLLLRPPPARSTSASPASSLLSLEVNEAAAVDRDVNEEFLIGGHLRIPVPVGYNFPRPHPRQAQRGKIFSIPAPCVGK